MSSSGCSRNHQDNCPKLLRQWCFSRSLFSASFARFIAQGSPAFPRALQSHSHPGVKPWDSFSAPVTTELKSCKRMGQGDYFALKKIHFISAFSCREGSTVVPTGNFCSRRANSLTNPLSCDDGDSGHEPAEPFGNSCRNEEFWLETNPQDIPPRIEKFLCSVTGTAGT